MTTNNDWSGVPAGYERIGFRVPVNGEDYVGVDGKVITCCGSQRYPRLIVRKLPPRLVPLEACDIKPDSDAVRNRRAAEWYWNRASVSAAGNGVDLDCGSFVSWEELARDYVWHTSGEPCSKPEGAVS